MRADAFATCLANKDYRSFWSSIHKQSSAKSTIHANVIDGFTGDGDVPEMWRQHYRHKLATRVCFLFNLCIKHGYTCPGDLYGLRGGTTC